MWLTSTKVPDHNTINRFRSSRLKDVLKTVFATIVTFLVAEGFVSWTWPAPTERRWRQTPTVIRSSGASPSTSASPESRNSLRRYGGTQIHEALEGTDADRKVKAKVRRVRKAWPEQLKKYESQGKILDGRNSYSKTDPDATFMRMKEDYMRNGQLKPGYNPQVSTNRQFILNYTLHQYAGETSTYHLHMKDFHSLYGRS